MTEEAVRRIAEEAARAASKTTVREVAIMLLGWIISVGIMMTIDSAMSERRARKVLRKFEELREKTEQDREKTEQ